MEYLFLEDNLIRDIEVLETIPNLQEVSLSNNPLGEQAEQVIQHLEDNGVIVEWENNGDSQSE
ncbi:leucine-rich repeat domain-containing protein [Paenibacillus pedocola]|uniref:leucine-rich repeat domain-containing protein n=1 Tax=Paenibacillus pedocola TaxID=3242193 RepID=UPI002877502F|nr:leucine-rich repeat domain-containing protein [Paenibacillus typhae]